MLLNRRQTTRLLFGGVVASLLAGCQAAPAEPTQTPVNPLIKPRSKGGDLTAVRANSDLAVGPNRFAVGLVDANNQPVSDGKVLVEFFKVGDQGEADKRSDADAIFRSVSGPTKGIWVATTNFDQAGRWTAQLTLDKSESAAPLTTQLNFEVLDKSIAPGYGQLAPRSQSPVQSDIAGDVSRICSSPQPCPLHTISIRDALDGTQPLVAVFATPALCTSALCAPQLDTIQQLYAKYRSRANFVHVEIYQYPFDATRVAPTVAEWRLPTDPWTFLVDRSGAVQGRFEGPAPLDELEPALTALLT
jgi:YtkA-like